MKPPVIPCTENEKLKVLIDDYAEILGTQAHTLGTHSLPEEQFYSSGILRGAIEKLRGQYSAGMVEKRKFVSKVFDYMQDCNEIQSWISSGDANRHDYTVYLPSGRAAVVELKGCLDGNNTTIFERPSHAQEFVLWSLCSNYGSDPRHNVWSGIHTRLSAEIIENQKQVDGLVVWDWLCGNARPCPKLALDPDRCTTLGHLRVPPPCIYLFPRTVPSVRNNPDPETHTLAEVSLLEAMHRCFRGLDRDLNQVRVSVSYSGRDLVRETSIWRDNKLQHRSGKTPIRRR